MTSLVHTQVAERPVELPFRIAQLTEIDRSMAADQPSPIGVLLTAPEFRRGIDWLSPNVIPHWAATYRAAVGGAGGEVQVIFVAVPVVEARQWAEAPCQFRSLRQSGTFQYYYESRDGWSLFIASARDGTPMIDPPCEFVDLFVTKFLFFRSLEAERSSGATTSSVPSGHTPPFPAILAPR